MRSGEEGQAQVEGRRVERIHRLIQLDAKRVVDVETSGGMNQDLRAIGLDGAVPGFVGIGQRTASHKAPKSQVVKFPLHCLQAGFDISEALAGGGLCEGHTEELVQTRKALHFVIAPIPFHTLVEFLTRQEFHDLKKDGSSRIHLNVCLWHPKSQGSGLYRKRRVSVKILHVVPSFGLGGMEKVLCSVMNSLPPEREQEVLSLDGERGASKWIRRRNIRLVDFHRPRGNVRFLKALFRFLRQSKPALLMTYNWGATDAIWLGRLAGIKTIIHNEHGFNVDEAMSTQWKRNAVRFIVYRLVTKIIVVSVDLGTMMQNQFKLKARKVLFIPNGVDTDYYSPNDDERERVRRELGLKESDLVVGFSGRLDPVKNFPFLMEVFERCVRADPSFKLVLIGDGPERNFIERFCSENHLRDRVVFVGQRETVLPYLRALDVFLLTSFREQMPMGMLETMSVGVPVVASAVGEIPSILKGSKAGFVFECRADPPVFAQSLLKMKNAEIRNRMGEAARGIVLNRFQEKIMIQKYTEVFEAIV